jgi:Fe2+ or Zn2+ uptake regulation protein
MKHNDDLVLDIIKNNTKSLTAYEILSKVQRLKKIQPMSVYRSLKNLQTQGKSTNPIRTKASYYVKKAIMNMITILY